MNEKITKRISEEAVICKLIRNVCTEGEVRKKSGKPVVISTLFNDMLQKDMKYVKWTLIKDRPVLTEAERQIDRLLIETEIKDKIKEMLISLRTARKVLLDSIEPDRPFPDCEHAMAYLNQYRSLLKEIFEIADIFADYTDTRKRFLLDILNIDIQGEVGEMYASIYSPSALDALLQVYNYVEEYIGMVSKWDSTSTDTENSVLILKSNYQAVIISKTLRLFRWIVVNDTDEEVYQAAVPAAIPLDIENELAKAGRLLLDIPVRMLNSYSSYEGIGELRLFDKIIYELERRKNSGKRDYHVLIVGDIIEKPIQILCQAIEEWFILKSKGIPNEKNTEWDRTSIYLNILTQNVWNDKKSSVEIRISDRVRYKWEKYTGQLIDGSELNSLIEKNDWMFLLDACDLYNEMYFEKQDLNIIRERVETEHDISIAKQQQMLYTLALTGCCGTLKKEINQTLFKYLGRSLRKYEAGAKSAYIYISDQDAISQLDYCDEYFIRIERYNEKEFIIIRMPGMDEGALPEEHDRKIIVLNLWQVIKHCTVRNIDCFLGYFGMKDIPSAISIFRDTLIGVEYSNWPESLQFYYSIPQYDDNTIPEGYEDQLKSWIEMGIMPYFKAQSGNMFYNYFVKVFSSFLYSDAKSVDDMLFLHLFINQHHLLKDTVLAGSDDMLGAYQSQKCKYSQKQFYSMVMEDYDSSSQMFMYKYRKLDLMEKADSGLRQQIFRKVLDACNRNRYGDSYLATNCLKMI